MQNDTFRAALADSKVPFHLHEGLVRWVENGIPPGSFLRAVISNDLLGAIFRADETSLSALYDICAFLNSEAAPASAFFREHALEQWPVFIQADNRAEANEAARLALESVVAELPEGSDDV